jgi:hypothetical protein
MGSIHCIQCLRTTLKQAALQEIISCCVVSGSSRKSNNESLQHSLSAAVQSQSPCHWCQSTVNVIAVASGHSFCEKDRRKKLKSVSPAKCGRGCELRDCGNDHFEELLAQYPDLWRSITDSRTELQSPVRLLA